ncbi:thiaminase (transcriptional activator TenA) [Prauserella flava]|nr:thiaminase (transcriptional activator TenA) [Prauserella flava]MCR3733489.1 thiaminase (transcriptional activator TenA) [Prauserella salsuginis]
MSRSRHLLHTCEPALERAAGMRFVRDVHDGTIGEPEYARYLEFEAGFVDTAARLHGLAVWQAPHWRAVTRNAGALHGLTTEQTEYFAAARAAWPVAAEVSDAARRAASVLSDYAVAAAEDGGYPAVTTVLFAAETLYLTWCTRAHRDGTPPAGPIADWVALHTRDPFVSGVDALGAAVDELPADVPDDRLAAWFTGMLDAEISFHDAVYL